MKINLFLTVSILAFSSCKDKNPSITPVIQNISESVYASGIIKSKNQYQVFSKVNGILKKIFVKEGDFIKKGDPLFQLDNSTAILAADNARLAANNADYIANWDKLEDVKNNVKLAGKKLETDSLLFIRQKNLWDKNIGSKVEFEQKELNYDNARNTLQSLEFKLIDLEKQLRLLSGQSHNNLLISKTNENDLLIRSEVNGRIYSIDKEENELVTTQFPIALVGDAEHFMIELYIDEKDIVKIEIGKPVMVLMDSYKGQSFEASVSSLDPLMNERTRTFKAEAEFIKGPKVLYPNLTVEANIVIEAKQNVLTIPRNYLINDSMVKLENGTLQKVSTGLMDYNFVEINSGLVSGTKIKLPD